MSLLYWPWEENKKPFWINPENNIHWFIDEDLNQYCIKKNTDLVAFIVAELIDNEFKPISRTLISKTTNELVFKSNLYESICIFVDLYKFRKNNNHEQ